MYLHVFVYLQAYDVNVSQVFVFLLHCTLTAVSNKASYDLCMPLRICVCFCVWFDKVFILLSNPYHPQIPGVFQGLD